MTTIKKIIDEKYYSNITKMLKKKIRRFKQNKSKRRCYHFDPQKSIIKSILWDRTHPKKKALRSKKPSITIREHWNRKEFVIVNMGELSYTVCAKDLEKAIQNAQNAHSGF